jgi:hypothetical protein
VQMVKTKHITRVSGLTMKCACQVGECPVGCGWPGPVFGPAVPYFLAC